MADALLIGNDTTGESGNSSNFHYLGRFQAIANGNNVTDFRVYCTGAGNIKANIYSDNSGEPNTLLSANNTGTSVVSGWNSIIVPVVTIISGTWYWLGLNADAAIVRRNNTGGTIRYKSSTYSTFTAPDPAGTGFNTDSLNMCVTLYGESGSGILIPTIYSISDPTIINNQSGITILGSNFN